MPPFQLLQRLPSELLQDILSYLPKSDLSTLNLASRWTYSVATPLIWREVTLTDCSTPQIVVFNGDGGIGSAVDEMDHHDDIPLLRKLVILATKPWIAEQVQVLNHRCHLPPVGIFNELPRTPLSGQTMSFDPRTIELVKRAVKGMVRVHTVRIIFGHANLNDALLRGFFDKSRARQNPVRRLWLEDCRLAAGCDLLIPSDNPAGLPAELDFTRLESLRLRRMPLRPAATIGEAPPRYDFVHARGTSTAQLQDGHGGMYVTTTNEAFEDRNVPLWGIKEGDAEAMGVDIGNAREMTDQGILYNFSLPMKWDDLIYEGLDDACSLPKGLLDMTSRDDEMARAKKAWRGPLLDPEGVDDLLVYVQGQQRERMPSARVALNMLGNASSTLTSLCLDWVLAMPQNLSISMGQDSSKITDWLTTYADLFTLRFPSLRAFQYRNAVTIDTILPPGLFLLDHFSLKIPRADVNVQIPDALRKRLDLVCLEFMEAHPNLQCLAWPMDGFFSAKTKRSVDIAQRVQSVIGNLGRTLIDLRADTLYSSSGERQSENFGCHSPQEREQRRRFIVDFASKMTKVESIKLEGGIPRDERREVLRALPRCPLKKIVLIGVCCPIGNTWGSGGTDILTTSEQTLDVDEIASLEGEHKDAIHRLGYSPLSPPSPTSFAFEPDYGWSAGPPMLHTIASYHAETVTELKFCGYKGAPVLFEPTPITAPMLAPLKHFHSLRSLIMSFRLATEFEGEGRDHEIISYWLDSRSPATTSLVRISTDEDDMGGWERELTTKFAPTALAGQVVKQMGPNLSETAKGRKNGVHVRASMCLGDWGGIFDIDVDIGKDASGQDVCLGFKGPREELEEERRRSKLEARRWF